MASAKPPCPLVLMDLLNQYAAFDGTFDGPIFSRLTQRNACIDYVSQMQTNIANLLHWFVPDSEHTVVGAGYVSLSTCYHIYCANNQTREEMLRTYNMPLIVKILCAEDLLLHLKAEAALIAVDRVGRTFDPADRDFNLELAIEFADGMGAEARQQMLEKTGVQPEEKK